MTGPLCPLKDKSDRWMTCPTTLIEWRHDREMRINPKNSHLFPPLLHWCHPPLALWYLAEKQKLITWLYHKNVMDNTWKNIKSKCLIDIGDFTLFCLIRWSITSRWRSYHQGAELVWERNMLLVRKYLRFPSSNIGKHVCLHWSVKLCQQLQSHNKHR